MSLRATIVLGAVLAGIPGTTNLGVHIAKALEPLTDPGTSAIATSLAEILTSTPLPEGTPLAKTPIARTPEFSASVVQARGELPPHTHAAHDELVVVTGGEGTMRIGDKEFPATQGAIFFLPRGTVHAFTSKGSDVASVVSVFGPAFDGKDRIFLEDAVQITGESESIR